MPQRVLIFSKSKRRTCFPRSFSRGLTSLGHEARICYFPRLRSNFGVRIARAMARRAFDKLRPDLVFVYAKDCDLELLEEFVGKTRCVVYSEDLVVPLDQKLLTLARVAGLLLLSNRTQLPLYEAGGVERTCFVLHAVDPEEHRPFPGKVPSRLRSQVAFIGRPGNPHRLALLEKLHARFDVRVHGSDQWAALGLRQGRVQVLPSHYAQICAGADVMIGLDDRHEYEAYCSNRTWFTLGCKGFLVTSHSPELDRILRDREHVVFFRSHDECVERVAEFLDKKEERKRIAEGGYAWATTHRTFTDFAREVLEAVAGSPPVYEGRIVEPQRSSS